MNTLARFIACLLITLNAYAAPVVTKERIAQSVHEIKSAIRARLNSGSSCRELADKYANAVDESHKLFLEDKYIAATLRIFQLNAQAAYYAINIPYCDSSTATRVEASILYSVYMHLERGIPPLPRLEEEEHLLKDGDKEVIVNLTRLIHNTMVQTCSSVYCTPEDRTIFTYNEAIREQLKRERPSYSLIAYYSAVIKGTIGDHYINSKHTHMLYDIYEKNTLILRIVKPYIFLSPNTFSAFNVRLIELLIDEGNPASQCAYTLSNYFNASFDSPVERNIPQLIAWSHKLYDITTHHIFFGRFYSNSCTMSKSDLLELPLVFTNEVARRMNEL